MKQMQVIRGGMALGAALLLGTVSLAAPLIRPVEAVAGQPGYDPDEWALVANHTHSSTGIGKYRPEGLEAIVEKASEGGYAMVIVTDHNTVEHWYDPAFTASGDVVLVQGTEWTSDDGHANIVGYATEDAADVVVPCDWEHAAEPCSGGIDYQDMVEEVHARDGLVIINHPRLRRHLWPEDAMGADAVEVNRNLTDVFGRGGRAWWHRRLAEGHRMAAVGGSDWHYWSPFGNDPEPGPHHDDHPEHGCVTEEFAQTVWPVPGFGEATDPVPRAHLVPYACAGERHQRDQRDPCRVP